MLCGPFLTNSGTVVPPWTGPTIDTFITPFGKYDLLAWMNKYVAITIDALLNSSC